MAVAKRCDKCGKFYEGSPDRMFKTEDGFYVNSIRLGHWDSRKKEWVSIASAYDLCKDCAQKLYEDLCGGDSNVQMHKKVVKTDVKPAHRKHDISGTEDVQAATVDAEQKAFAESESTGDDE